MTNLSILKKLVPFFLCAAPLSALLVGCGTSDAAADDQNAQPGAPELTTPGATEGESGSRASQPSVPGNAGRDPGGRPRDGGACEFGGFSWQAQPFSVDSDEQACLGDQWVRYDDRLRLWVGLTTCSIDETRIYLSTSPEGPFFAATDTAGHGQDHCELVNAAFTLTDEDDITSGGCTDCSTGPNLPLEGVSAYGRANLGEAFEFVESTPEWSYQVSRLRCGVELGCKGPAEPPPPQPAGPWVYGTADGGNADGVRQCSEGRYDHYEEPSPDGPALHLVGVYQPGESGEIAVSVTRPGPSVLVLSSYEPATWVVTVAPGAVVERVVLYGYEAQTAVVPEGVAVENHSFVETGEFVDVATSWPSVSAAQVVAHVEATTGRALTSFRSCYEAAGFQIDAPGELRPPHPSTAKAEPTLPRGCEALAAESNYCLGLQGGAITAIGLDSGTLCSGPTPTSLGFDFSSIGWVGDYVYACDFERGLYRISVLDGSVDVAPVGCDAATSHAGGILVSNALFSSGSEAPGLLHFDNFESVLLGSPQRSFDQFLQASRFATNGDQLYAAWHSTNAIETTPLAPGGEVASVSLQDFDTWVWAMDVLDDGRLLINSGFVSDVSGFLVFDARTGASQGVLPVNTGGVPFDLAGLDCVSRPVRK